MTGRERRTGTGRNRDRFVIHDGDVEITGRHPPTGEEQDEGDSLFNRILKNRKQKKGKNDPHSARHY